MFWLLPAAAPAAAEAAVAATVVFGSAAYIGADVLGFRRGGLPPATGQAPGEVTVAEAAREMVRGALVPNSQTGNLFPQPPPLNELLLLPALAQLGKWLQSKLNPSQVWGLLSGGRQQKQQALDRARTDTWPRPKPGGRVTYQFIGWYPPGNTVVGGVQLSSNVPATTQAPPEYGSSNVLFVFNDPINGPQSLLYPEHTVPFLLNVYDDSGTGLESPSQETGSGFFPKKAVPVMQAVMPWRQFVKEQAAFYASIKTTKDAKRVSIGGSKSGTAPKPLPLIQTPAQAAALQQLVRAYQLPSATRLTSAGALPAAAPAAAAQTATQARTYGPVTINTTAPRATLEGIAEEVGRVEQKLGELLNPNTNNQPDWLEKLRQLWDLMNAINNILQAQGAGGSYTASSPCVTNSQGQRIVTEIEFEGANDQFGVIRNRIDALADLMQQFKDLRQPICKGAPTSNVTVTAYEVSPE